MIVPGTRVVVNDERWSGEEGTVLPDIPRPQPRCRVQLDSGPVVIIDETLLTVVP